MDRKLVSYMVGSFGLGILSSAIIYPLGYLESIHAFRAMTIIGTAFIFIGLLVRPKILKEEKHAKIHGTTNSQSSKHTP